MNLHKRHLCLLTYECHRIKGDDLFRASGLEVSGMAMHMVTESGHKPHRQRTRIVCLWLICTEGRIGDQISG